MAVARILLIEPDRTVREVVAHVLRESGHVVDEVMDSAAVLAALRVQQYEVLLLDASVQAHEAVHFARNAGVGGRFALVVMSTIGLPQLDRIAAVTRICGVLHKPFRITELDARVRRALACVQGARDGLLSA